MTESTDTRVAASVAPLTRRGAILAALTLSGALAVAMPSDARTAPVETPGPLAAGIQTAAPNPYESEGFGSVEVSEIEDDLVAFLQEGCRRPRLPFGTALEVSDALAYGSTVEAIERERRQYHDALRRQRARLLDYLRHVDGVLAESPALPADLLP